jgi:predicted RNA-binding Zn ribbon-like protein
MSSPKKPRKSAPRDGYDRIVWTPHLVARFAQASAVVSHTKARTYGVIVAEEVNAAADHDWRVIRQMLTESLAVLGQGRLTDEAIDRFNKLTRRRRTSLYLTDTNVWGKKMTSAGWGSRSWAAEMFWELVNAQGLHRLKRCAVCSRWFYDTSRNESAVRCSAACTRKWWNRARRRAANHKG